MSFTRPTSIAEEKWDAVLSNGFYVGKQVPVRAHALDIDGDGAEELCLQVEGHLVVVKDRQVSSDHDDCWLAPVPVEGDARSWYALVTEHTVALFHGGEKQWERPVPGSQGERYRSEANRGCGVLVADVDRDGQVEVLVFTSRGRLHAFRLDGQPCWHRVLARGKFHDASMLVAADANHPSRPLLVVSARCTWRRRLLGPKDWGPDHLTCVLDGRRLCHRQWDAPVSHPVAGSPGELLAADGSRFRLLDGVLTSCNGIARREGSSRKSLPVVDPAEPGRVALALWEGPTQGLTLTAADGTHLWACHLGRPPAEIEVEHGVLGRASSPADGLVALRFTETRVLAEYQAKVQTAHVAIFDRSGTLLGVHDIPARDREQEPVPILLDDLDGDGRVELVLLGRERLQVLEVAVDLPRADAEMDSALGLGGLPPFPLPPEDPWAVDLLDEAAARGGES